ncbi:hypothetical protein BOSEA31B_13216 [Hyphomicrobiales bacterium]|nr:hypothetical protein BOSEA31B_13216 [Hyphomicrobiales bacterium]CAH1698990.1 hypothetical protein BOSEA1005_12043 [Hyphomicrobiales bacterium]
MPRLQPGLRALRARSADPSRRGARRLCDAMQQLRQPRDRVRGPCHRGAHARRPRYRPGSRRGLSPCGFRVCLSASGVLRKADFPLPFRAGPDYISIILM